MVLVAGWPTALLLVPAIPDGGYTLALKSRAALDSVDAMVTGSSNGDIFAILDSQPSYFKESDGRFLQEGEMPTALVRYWLNLSRIQGLILIPTRNALFQLISTRVDDGARSTLEVWHTDGCNVASGIDTPDNLFLFEADAKWLYFVGSAEKDQNPPIHVYEFQIEDL